MGEIEFKSQIPIIFEIPEHLPADFNNNDFINFVKIFLKENNIDKIKERLKKEITDVLKKSKNELNENGNYIELFVKFDNESIYNHLEKNYFYFINYLIEILKYLKKIKLESKKYYNINKEKEFLKDIDINNITIKEFIEYIEISSKKDIFKVEFLFFIKNLLIEDIDEFLNCKIKILIKKIRKLLK